MSNPLDAKVLDHLRSITGSTAWAMRGVIGEDRPAISKALQRLKCKGLVETCSVQSTYWQAVKP